MSRKLNFEPLEAPNTVEAPEQGTRFHPTRAARWQSREPNPTVQMSLRMPAETYERFRALCERERRTNGDMLRVLMEGYLDRSGAETDREASTDEPR